MQRERNTTVFADRAIASVLCRGHHNVGDLPGTHIH
jgi:hypothetical protein